VPTPKPAFVELPHVLERQVQQYADQHGLTLEQASTQLVQQTIKARYIRKQTSAAVLFFHRPKN